MCRQSHKTDDGDDEYANTCDEMRSMERAVTTTQKESKSQEGHVDINEMGLPIVRQANMREVSNKNICTTI